MSGGYTLPCDASRCHDAECPQHSTCARWVQRALPAGERLSAVASMREGGSCGYYRVLEVGYAGYAKAKKTGRRGIRYDRKL